MSTPLEQVRQLREMTGAGVMECRKAVAEAKGNVEKAVAVLRERGVAVAQAKESRKADEGIVMAYVHHGGKLGALVELNCESDFVARNAEFIALAKEISMQVAATSPCFITREDAPAAWLDARREEFAKQAESVGKGTQAGEYVKEKMEQLLNQVCLLEQPHIRDSVVTVNSLITEKVAKFGERIRVRRFVVFKLGEKEETVS